MPTSTDDPPGGRARYLLAVYILESRGSAPVSSGEVAELLERSPAAVTEALGRLDDRGLVDLEPYEGATLTADGHDAVAPLHESYVRLSWFFRSVLDLDDHEAEAMELAGAVSPDVAARLTDTLPYDEAADGEPAPADPDRSRDAEAPGDPDPSGDADGR